MNIEDILPVLSPTARAFVEQALAAGADDAIAAILEILAMAPSIEEGLAQVEAAIQEFLGAQGMDPLAGGAPVGDPAMGVAGGMPGAPPEGSVLPDQMGEPMAGAPVGAGAPLPAGMDPMMLQQMGIDPAMLGMPPGGGMMPPPGMVPPGMVDPMTGMPMGGPPPGPPQQQQQAPPPQRPKEKPKVKVPAYKVPPVPQVEKPTLEQIREDARAGRSYWQPRDTRIKDDYDLYHLVYDGATLNQGDDTIIHKRTQPAMLIDRVTGIVTPRNGKLTVEIEPRADDDDYVAAAQAAEDAVMSWREQDEEWWLENRVAEPPLPRKEAGLAALEGGFGWSWTIDAENDAHPFQYEIIPLSQLYDVGHATTRQFQLPLHQARARYKKIRDAYPIDGKKGRDGGWWDPNQLIRITIHADNSGVWKSMVYEEVGGIRGDRHRGGRMAGEGAYPDRDDGKRSGWIERPKRINFGFRYFNYMVWGGSPGEALQGAENQLVALKGYGVLTQLRKTFRLMDLFISAIATGALTGIEPATLTEVPDNVNPLKARKIDRRPGANTNVPAGTKVTPLRWDLSATSDAQNILNSLIAELQDVSAPALSGAAGPSGISQMVSTEQASNLVVAPMIDALEKWFALQHKQRLILALRYSNDDKYNKDAAGKVMTLFDEYEKRSFRGETAGQYGVLKPADIEKSGVRVIVRYHDRNTQEEMALAQMVTQLVGAHLMSQETALRRMGVKDPRRELNRIFADGAFTEPAVLKAIVETAVYNSGNQILIDAWDKAFYADAMGGQKGSAPAPAGTASMPAPQPGMADVGQAVPTPGAQQMGMMV